ncbi:MAG: polysaccharide deacetylase family protein [Thermodesulfobacteriota bacterium]
MTLTKLKISYRLKLLIRDLITYLLLPISSLKIENSIPILVYHSVDDIPPHEDLQRLNTPPSLFEQHIKYLVNAGYRVISLNNLGDYLKKDKQNCSKMVVLTFDDGYKNWHHNAYPILQKYGYPATIFIICECLDSNEPFGWIKNGTQYGSPLSIPEIKEILKDNFTVGSHSLSHPDLTKLAYDDCIREIGESKKRLEEQFGKSVDYFAYPFGARVHITEDIKKHVRNAGYKGAVSNIMGINKNDADFYSLKRIRIDWHDNISRFRLKLIGAYNWLDRFR